MKARNNKIYTVKYRRKRNGKTDYKKRLNLLKNKKIRLVIRKSINNMVAQIVEYKPNGDRIIASANSKELSKYGYTLHGGNSTAAYLVGVLVGKKAKEAKVTDVVVDLGLNQSTKGSRMYTVVKGAIDAGLAIPCSKDILPTDERAKGKHIEDYAKKLKENKEKYEKQFSQYIKNKVNPEETSKLVEDVKNKILKGGN